MRTFTHVVCKFNYMQHGEGLLSYAMLTARPSYSSYSSYRSSTYPRPLLVGVFPYDIATNGPN